MDSINAREELIEHLAEEVGNREVKYVYIKFGYTECKNPRIISGALPEVLPLLEFEYDNGFGGQQIFGNIWYQDGTWSERGEYDGSEWWELKVCPDIPKDTK